MSYNDSIRSYEWIVKKVLTEIGMSPQASDYEDFAQELRLTIYLELLRIEEKQLTISNMNGYMIQVARWRAYNLIRYQQRHQHTPYEDTYFKEIPSATLTEDLIDSNADFIETLEPHLQMLIKYLFHGYKMHQIATLMNKNVRTIRRWRRQLGTAYLNNHTK